MSILPNTSAPSRAALLLVACYVAVYLLPLGARPLARPDEVRYGTIAKEMIRSGDWVSPTFNGARYFEKPVLGYWLDAASLELFGSNAFALRLPSALAAGLTALIIFALTLRFAGRRTALIAAGIFLSTFEVMGLGTFALLDSFLSLFVTAAIASFYLAQDERRPARRGAYLVFCGSATACAFLTKGFLALALPAIVLVPYLAWVRRWRALLISPWLPAIVALLLVLPWSILIYVREPDFWRYFFWVEHVQRFFSADAQHAEAPWYYFVNLLWAGLPWILLLPATIAGLKKAPIDRSFLKFVVLWAVIPLCFLSLARGKLITYILPCFAPLAILSAAGLEQYLTAGKQLALRIAVSLIGALFLVGLTLVLAAQQGLLDQPVYTSAEYLRLAILLTVWTIGLGCAGIAGWNSSRITRFGAVAATAVALFLPLNLALPTRVLDRVAPRQFFAQLAPVGRDSIVISDAPTFGSVAWFLNRDDIYLVSPGEIDYGLSYPDSRDRYLDQERLVALLQENAGRREIVIICETGSETKFRALLPASAQRSQRGELVAWRIKANG